MKKRIVFAIPNLGRGGAESVLSRLANKFNEENWDVHLLLLDNYLISNKIENGINIKFISFDAKKNKVLRYYNRMKAIRKEVKAIDPDVVVSFLTSANIIISLSLIFLRVSVIISERSDPKKNVRTLSGKALRWISYGLADGIVCQTEEIKSYYFKLRIQKKVIYNPVDIKASDKKLIKKEKIVVTACRLVSDKNIEMLIYAFNEFYKVHPDYILKIFGDGPHLKTLKTISSRVECSKQIYFMGMSSNWHLEALKAEMFVNTSDYEGMSNSLMEALALGLPCIATDLENGSSRILIDDYKNGILTEIGDYKSLSRKMIQLSADDLLKEKLSKNAILIRSRFCIEKIYHDWVEYIRELEAI